MRLEAKKKKKSKINAHIFPSILAQGSVIQGEHRHELSYFRAERVWQELAVPNPGRLVALVW